MIKKCMLLVSILSFFIIVLIFIIIISFQYASDPKGNTASTEIGHVISYFKDMNQISFKIDKTINNNIAIKWNEVLIYEKGESVYDGQTRYIYGSNIFKVEYEGKSIKIFEQYKYNNWFYYNYVFTINKKNEEILVEMEIEGPEASIREIKK